MRREIVIILGKTGYGKSVWLRQFCSQFPRVFVYDPLKAFEADYLDYETIIRKHDAGDFKNARAFRIGSGSLEDFSLLGSLAYINKNCVLVGEECAKIFDKGERIEEWLSDIVFLGRHNAVSLVVTAQRAASIPIDLRSQATRLVSFAQTEGDDVNWLKAFLGNRVKELGTLKILECLDATTTEINRYSIHL